MIGSNSVLNSMVVVELKRTVDYIRTVYSVYYDSLPEKIRKVGDISMFHFCAKNIPPDQKERFMCVLSGLANSDIPKKLFLFYKNGVKFIDLRNVEAGFIINYELHKDGNNYILKSKFITQDGCILHANSSKEYKGILKSELKYVVIDNEIIDFEKIVKLCKAILLLDGNALYDRMIYLDDLFKYCDYTFEEIIDMAGGEEAVDSVKFDMYPVTPVAKGIIHSEVAIYEHDNNSERNCYIYIVNNEHTKCAILFPVNATIPSHYLRQIVLYDFNTGKVRFYFTRHDTMFYVSRALYDGKTNVIVGVKTLSGKIVCLNIVNKKLELETLNVGKDSLLRIDIMGCEDNWVYIIGNHDLGYQEYSSIIIPSYIRITETYVWTPSGDMIIHIISNNHPVYTYGTYHYGMRPNPTECIIYKYILSHKTTFMINI